MQNDVGIGMAGDAASVGDAQAAQRDMVAIGERMHVEPEARAHIARSRKLHRLDVRKIVGRGELHIADIALEGTDPEPRPFGKRGIVSEVVAACRLSAPMCID